MAFGGGFQSAIRNHQSAICFRRVKRSEIATFLKVIRRIVLTSSRQYLKIKKENTHASCKTRNQTPRQAQENIRARQRLLPHQIEAVPLGERSGRARSEVCLLGTQAAQAAVPLAVDRAHRRRRQAERDELQPV